MSIPDKAVEALVEVLRDRQVQRPVGRHLSDIARAGLEAAEPYLTGGEGWLRAQLEEQVKTWEGLTSGNALTEFDRGAMTARLLALRNLRALLAAVHPEVKS